MLRLKVWHFTYVLRGDRLQVLLLCKTVLRALMMAR
ncbi:hypothetical protein AFFFEF_01926 [Methylorubrum extorquens]